MLKCDKHKLGNLIQQLKLEDVFMKHYAPNHMLAPTVNIYHLRLLSLIGKSGIIQSNIYRILRKVNQVICIMYSNSMPDIMILAQAVLQIYC